jgi:hypothetical protein
VSTDDLIARLGASTTARRAPRVGLLLAVAAAVGALAALALALAIWGPRHDLPRAVVSMHFWMKAGYALALAAAGLLALERLGRPGERAPIGMTLAGLAVLAVLGLAAHELMILPRGAWMPVLKGHSWQVCSLNIAALSGPGFLAALWALRQMAPTRPRLAGAAAGLMAGGLGAAAYGVACNETAASFLASWYSLGMLAWAAVGALLGPRLLRW